MIEPDRKIVMFGCGGHSRSVTDIILLRNPQAELVFVDDNARVNEKIYEFNVYREYTLGGEYVFFAIGDNKSRKNKFAEIGENNLISIISPTAHLGFHSNIGKGCFVGNFCHIGPESVIVDA